MNRIDLQVTPKVSLYHTIRSALFGALLAIGFVAGLAAAPAYAQTGDVVAQQKISETQGSFTGNLDPFDSFGGAAAGIGDLDGDGVGDMIIGAPHDDDGGSGINSDFGGAYVVFLNQGGTVKAIQKISALEGGFTGTLQTDDFLGSAVTVIGDLDNDGNADVAVSASGDDDGGFNRGAVYVLFLNSNGTVKAQQKISSLEGGFGGTLITSGEFGSAVAGIGDLDNDGVADLAVGQPRDDDGGSNRGAVWILFLNSDGTVKAEQKISAISGSFPGTLNDDDRFGASLGVLGDLDGDNVEDLAVGAPRADDGESDSGSVWVLGLRANGTVRNAQKISATEGGFAGALNSGDRFGESMSGVGDIDGDGNPDLVVGAPFTDDGGVNQGAIWIVFLASNGTSASEKKISATSGTFGGELGPDDNFGASVATPGDLDNNGAVELFAGTPNDDDGENNAGAGWVMYITGPACGNNFVDAAEDCDDGNTLDGDCCSSLCFFEANGSGCSDGDVCNGEDEFCDGAGTCLPGTPLDCDDGSPCTQDTCDAIAGCSNDSPGSNCKEADKGLMVLFDHKINDEKDSLRWKFLKGDEITAEELGDPTDDTEYAICVYDSTGGVPQLKSTVFIPAGLSTPWTIKPHIPDRLIFRDDALANDGMRIGVIKGGKQGKTKVIVKALRGNLPTPVPVSSSEIFDQDPSVIIEMINNRGMCIRSEFNTSQTSANDDRTFKAVKR